MYRIATIAVPFIAIIVRSNMRIYMIAIFVAIRAAIHCCCDYRKIGHSKTAIIAESAAVVCRHRGHPAPLHNKARLRARILIETPRVFFRTFLAHGLLEHLYI